MVGRGTELKLQRVAALILPLAGFLAVPSADALSIANGVLILGIESEIGFEYTDFEESNKDNLPGDTEPEWDEFIEDNIVNGRGEILGTAIITAFPFLFEFAGGVDGVRQEFVLEQANMSLVGNSVSASLGKQDIIWGTGVLYYPLFFTELMDEVYGFQSRDFQLPQHWLAGIRIDGPASQTALRGIVDQESVESGIVPDWYFVQFYQQFYISSWTLSYQIAYQSDLEEEDHYILPGIDFSFITTENLNLFAGISGKTSLITGNFEPEVSMGVSWLKDNLFLSAESDYLDWFEIGLFLNYDYPGSAFSNSLTLKFDPVGLGYMGVIAFNYKNTMLDMKSGCVFMDGTERTYYGNSPVSFKLFANIKAYL